ncbi:SRPBCC domain-containing protein [Rhodobacteraceae bacterium D3-12]|nr:SRPBCC domain-containing protein [Rhodobacteraceae bacterium D3-12]
MSFEREIACTPETLFAVMTSPDAREIWGAPSETEVLKIDRFDLRPGGLEIAKCGPKSHPKFTTTTNFHEVCAPERLVFSETLSADGQVLSCALVTQEIVPTDGRVTLVVTLQICSLTGGEMFEGYRTGWRAALENLAHYAQEQTVRP